MHEIQELFGFMVYPELHNPVGITFFPEIADQWSRNSCQQTTSFCDDGDLWRRPTSGAAASVNRAPVDHVTLDDVDLTGSGRRRSASPSFNSPLTAVNYSAAAYIVNSRRSSAGQLQQPYDTNDDNYFDDDITGAKLLIRSDVEPLAVRGAVVSGILNATESSAIADEGLRQELDLFRTTRVLLASTALLWLPMTIANVVYATCESCRSAMSVGEVMTIKWVAYVSPLVAATTSVFCSEVLRQAVRSALSRCIDRLICAGNRRQLRRGGCSG
jgi:hypothetical protein